MIFIINKILIYQINILPRGPRGKCLNLSLAAFIASTILGISLPYTESELDSPSEVFSLVLVFSIRLKD